MSQFKERERRRKAPLSPWKSVNPNKAAKKKKPIEGVASLDHRFGIPMIAPFFIIFLIFGLAPVIYSIYISFYKCISNPNKYSSIKQAGRNTITNLIYNFKAENVIFNETLCSVTGEVLTKENTSIDHYDMTFDDMIMIWIEKKGVDVIFNELDHSGLGVFFKSDTIKNDFLDFHNTNCKLRAVTMKANLTICKQ